MTADLALELMRQTFLTGLALALPVLVAILLVGLVLGILQAATGVQEFTLSFVPKLLAAFGVVLLLGSLGLSWAVEFTVRMLMLIPQMGK